MLSSIPHKYIKSKEAYKNIMFTKGNGNGGEKSGVKRNRNTERDGGGEISVLEQ